MVPPGRGERALTAQFSVIVTAHEEGPAVVKPLVRLLDAVGPSAEILVVVDSPSDSSIPFVEQLGTSDQRIRVAINDLGRGPAKAIRYGFSQASSDIVVVTMADGCDDPHQIEEMVRLVERGVVVAAASRYSRGGQQIGAPFFKSILSRTAGITLGLFARIGTWDATNSFKAYSKPFVESVGIESDRGFEVGLELVAKARRLHLPVAEVPTIWLERTDGISKFRLSEWLPRYLKWYLYAFGLGK